MSGSGARPVLGPGDASPPPSAEDGPRAHPGAGLAPHPPLCRGVVGRTGTGAGTGAVGGAPAQREPADATNSGLRCSHVGYHWVPAATALRTLGVAVGGITHTVNCVSCPWWHKLDLNALTRRDAGGRAGHLRGHRVMVIAVKDDVKTLVDICRACAALGRRPQAAGVVVAHRARMLEAQALLSHAGVAPGLRIDAAAHCAWHCRHGTTSSQVDAWVFDEEPVRRAAASTAGLRRALRHQLNHALSIGDRQDHLRRSILLGGPYTRTFGAKAKGNAQELQAGDPYPEQASDGTYDKLPPVTIGGILDEQAREADQPLPLRQPPGPHGAPAYTAAQASAARALWAGAADVDAHACSEMHVEHCELCLGDLARRQREQVDDAREARDDERGGRSRASASAKGRAARRAGRARHRQARQGNVPRPFRHSVACYFHLLFLRLTFGLVWTCSGYVSPCRTQGNLDQMFPLGFDDPASSDSRIEPHSRTVWADDDHVSAYKRGLDKWYAVPGMCIPYIGIIPSPIPDGWCPPWTIRQSVVLKPKDVYKAKFKGGDPKARCVCDLRVWNKRLRQGRFQYTGVEDFAAQLEPGDWIAVVDIASFYLKIPLAVLMLRYMTFKDYFVEGDEGWQTHTRLPFGAGLAPFYACVLSAVALDILRRRGAAMCNRVAEWRAARRKAGKGKHSAARRFRSAKCPFSAHELAFAAWGASRKSTVYVDDVALAGSTAAATNAAVAELVAILARMGIPAKDKEDTWTARQVQDFLGIRIATAVPPPPSARRKKGSLDIVLSLTNDYRDYLTAQVHGAIARHERGELGIAHGDIDSMVGCLGWAASVMCGGPSRLCALHELRTVNRKGKRAAYLPAASGRAAHAGRGFRAKRLVELRDELYSRVTATGGIGDMHWWSDRLADPAWRGSKVLLRRHSEPVLIKSDASGTEGWGYHVLKASGHPTRGHGWDMGTWDAIQDAWGCDMVVKELFPVLAAARSLSSGWSGRVITFGTDNTGVVLSLNAGRVRTRLGRDLMRELGDLQQAHRFDVFSQWVPRELNEVADGLSRQQGYAAALAAAYPSGG